MMPNKKIKLKDLESLLMSVADELRGKMDASEYKEYIFGMLFIKRMSDVFDQKREALIRNEYKSLNTPEQKDFLNEILESSQTYGNTFFVPKRARWNESFVDENGKRQPAIKDLHDNIGQMLNKALNALEEANPNTLTGIFKDRINFNKEVNGKQIVKNDNLKKIIDKFNEFPPLVNENFEFTDLLGAAYEYLLKYFADQSGKKGGQYYTPNLVVRLLVQLIKPKEGMTVYDPTAGSGGMLIQSYQYIEEQGGNKNNVVLYGQELDPSVVAICKMNIILHNITNYHIEYGDTIADPLNLENGKIKQFDRVIANPPFSQNYSSAEMHFNERFKYGFAPETGKKADFMFVQHMLASCKPNGKVVVVMPHGVLFRGGKEKEIRQNLIEADLFEGIISLPEKLFYGTGIAASILVFNKQKPKELKNKIFIINADHDYAEGKNQNMLRPEDIEKIDHVFTNKIEEPKYSRLIDKSEIVANDYTLKIRTYVDNTPEPEPQDVHAHLVGGIPQTEIDVVDAQQSTKFKFNSNTLFSTATNGYADLLIADKTEIKDHIDSDKNVLSAEQKMNDALTAWWNNAKNDFSALAQTSQTNAGSYVTVRQTLLSSMNKALVPLGLLDKYQVPGVFVNWWDNIKYDLKTIMQAGWEPSLILDEDLIEMFFSDDKKQIDNLNAKLADEENTLSSAVEEALDLCEYDAETDDDDDAESTDDAAPKQTPKLAKDQLAAQIKAITVKADRKPFEDAKKKIEELEKQIKECKADIKEQTEQLNLKLDLKRYGANDKKAQLQIDIDNLNAQIKPFSNKAELTKKEKTQLGKLTKARDVLQSQYSKLDQLLADMGGVITDEQAQTLILKKHFGLISSQMHRYMDAERRTLIARFEKLADKYARSAQAIEKDRDQSLATLTSFLSKLGYTQ